MNAQQRTDLSTWFLAVAPAFVVLGALIFLTDVGLAMIATGAVLPAAAIVLHPSLRRIIIGVLELALALPLTAVYIFGFLEHGYG